MVGGDASSSCWQVCWTHALLFIQVESSFLQRLLNLQPIKVGIINIYIKATKEITLGIFFFNLKEKYLIFKNNNKIIISYTTLQIQKHTWTRVTDKSKTLTHLDLTEIYFFLCLKRIDQNMLKANDIPVGKCNWIIFQHRHLEIGIPWIFRNLCLV